MQCFKLNAEIGESTIPGFYVGPDAVSAFLEGLKANERATIEINSPGGSVIAGLAIANAIKNSKADITAHVVGLAASMASVIACACKRIQMEEASFMMIHDPWSYAVGNADELRKTADLLDDMKATCKAFYRGKFNRTPEELDALMSAETWMTGAECKAQGLDCEVISTDVRLAACATSLQFAAIPEVARQFLACSKTLPPDACGEGAGQSANAASVATTAPGGDSDCLLPVHQSQSLAAAAPLSTPSASVDWEARYKGASKSINALQTALDKAEKEMAEALMRATNAEDSLVEAHAKICDLSVKSEKLENDLAQAKAEVSSVSERAEKAEKALAETSEHLARLETAHALFTGGVLSPATGDYLAQRDSELSKAGSAEEREQIRAKWRKINN